MQSLLKRTIQAFAFCAICTLFGQAAISQVAEKTKSASESATQESEAVDEETAALHKKLTDYLTGTKWTGKFSVVDREDDDLTVEEYYILSAEKMEEGDYWKLVARIKYGENDMTVPLPLEIKWAGETPVITVDKMLVPGLGTFDARVLIRQGKYSGTWNHNKVGGHLFGEIEKMTEEELAEVREAAEKNKRRRK